MQIRKYLGATALMAVMAAPAFGQTIINQSTTDALNIDLKGSNAVIETAAPGSITINVPQSTTNLANVTQTGLVAVDNRFEVRQGAGFFDADGNQVANDLDMWGYNVLYGQNTGVALANVQVSGTQFAGATVNNVGVMTGGTTPVAGLPSVIAQQAGNLDMRSINQQSAVVQNGNSFVGLANTVTRQDAEAYVNTAAVMVLPANISNGATPPVITVSPAVLSLELKQELGGAGNSITATNSALANNVGAGGSSTLDPTVQNLVQRNQVNLTTVEFSAAKDGTAQVNLSGEQIETPNVRNNVTMGNTAVAYTGDTLGTGYNFFSGDPGNGIAIVKNVGQGSYFGMNQVTGGAGVSIAFSGSPTGLADGFTQTVSGQTRIATPAGGPDDTLVVPDTLGATYLGGGNYFPGIVNGIGVRTATGTATVDGGLQDFENVQNSISNVANLSGAASQNASGIVTARGNVVLSTADTGPSTIKNVGQQTSESYNFIGAGTVTGTMMSPTTLNQTAGGMGIWSGNLQAAGGSTTASITGARQSSSVDLNRAEIGALNGATLNQTAGVPVTVGTPPNTVTLPQPVGILNTNVLVAGGPTVTTTTLGGSQSAFGGVNTASLGSSNGGAVNQVAGDVSLTNTNAMTALGGFNVTITGSQTSGSSVNVIK